MLGKALVTLALSSAVALPADAAEFIPGWSVDGIGNSNVFRTERDEEAGFAIRTGPNVRFRQPTGDLTYDVNLRARYEDYPTLEGASDFDYFAGARGAWRVTDNTRLELAEDFISTSNLNGLLQPGSPVDPVAVVVPSRERVTANALVGSISHDLGPLWLLKTEVANNLQDYQNPDQSDSISTRASINLTRAISPRLIVGGGTQYTRQEFDTAGQTSGTSIYQGFGVLNYQFSPTWSLSAQAGPAWAIPDPLDTPAGDRVFQQYVAGGIDSCPTNSAGIPVIIQNVGGAVEGCPAPILLQTPSGQFLRVLPPSNTDTTTIPLVSSQVKSGTSLNYFGRIVLAKEWRQWRASVTYNRNASSSSGFGQSTVLDVIGGDLVWTPSRLWRVTLTTAYSSQSAISTAQTVTSIETSLRQETLNVPVILLNPDGSPVLDGNGQPVTGVVPAPVPVPYESNTIAGEIDNKATVDTIRVDLSGMRRISRNLTFNASAGYWHQESNRTFQATGSSQRDVYRIGFGFTWTFDPIPL